MFAFSFRGNTRAAIEGERVCLRHPELSDYREWADLRAASAEFLQPWEPRWPRDDLSRVAFRARLRRYNAEIAAGTGLPYFICRLSDGALLGGITLGHIRRGVSQSGQIGYWIGEEHASQGYMREAVNLTCQLAFTQFGLHRLEAACIPTNVRSANLLEKSGFEREGQLRSYLKIDGVWQDHILYSRVNPSHDDSSPIKLPGGGFAHA